MSTRARVAVSWLATGLLGISFSCRVIAAEPVDKPGWSWPSAASNLAVQGEIRRQERFLTHQEHRNLQTVLEFLSGYGRLADGQRWLTQSPQGFHKPDENHTLFHLLGDAFGASGYRDASLQDRINTVIDIVAKGDRVVALWQVNGTVNGPLFGFQGLGQPVEFLELMQFRFDGEGRILALDPWSVDDLLFYQQLGGRVELEDKTGKHK